MTSRQQNRMATDQIVKKLEPWLAKHRRPPWKPVVENGDGPPRVSKFSGMPWIGEDDPWPNSASHSGRGYFAIVLLLPWRMPGIRWLGTLRR
jgi:hypothetical protein